jgi:Leucine-rich repeat (LRR) protein
MFKIASIVIITLVITHISLQTQVLCKICYCNNNTLVCKKIPIKIDKRFLSILSHVSNIQLYDVNVQLRLIFFKKLKQLEFNKVYGLMRTPNLSYSSKLEEIIIKESQLKFIRKDLCFNKDFLYKIDFSGNDINGIAVNTFKKCRILSVLDLSRNKLTSLIFLRQVSNTLLNLNLDSNMIEHLLPYDFAHLSYLVELSLANNKIQVIDQRAFDGLKSLNKLNLQYNNILQLPDKSELYPHLYELYLGGNEQLLHLPKVSQFEVLDLIEVPYEYQCDLFKKENKSSELSNIIIDDFLYDNTEMEKCIWKSKKIFV